MNYRMIVRLLCATLNIVAAFLLPPLLISLYCGETASAIAFLETILLTLALGAPAWMKKPKKSAFYAREGYVVVALAWVLVSLIGALPFYLSGSIKSFVDCLFETVSGFTTTGASILKDVEVLPYGILYWRSFTHWLGGMGVLVFLLAIAPLSTGSGDSLHIMRAESPGPQVSKLVPKTRQSARILYEIYIGMTILEILLLLLGGMSLFEAVTISFGTAGTGGFAVKNSSMASYSPYIQWIVTIFMALFGVNFGVYYLLLMRSFRKAIHNEEMKFYFRLILISVGIVTIAILPLYGGSFADSLRHASFQVVSIMTTTGYATADYDVWPQICRMLLVMLMIVGACAGSTGGGVKCSRILIMAKSLRLSVRQMLHPNDVSCVRIDNEPVSQHTVSHVFAFLSAYSIIAVLSMLLVSADGFSFETNLSAVMACLNNIGPGLHIVGPTGNYSGFTDFVKILLSVDMLIGRLEIFPIVILLIPSNWKRART